MEEATVKSSAIEESPFHFTAKIEEAEAAKEARALAIKEADAKEKAVKDSQAKGESEEKASKAEEELQALLKKQKATEEELGNAKERLDKVSFIIYEL